MTNSLGNSTESPPKYGERAIREGELIAFPNPRPGRAYDVHITLPEFTCKCPFSGYPDFATLYLTYTPDEKVVELKALKLYINGFRDRYISHEEVVNQILDDFVTACDPLSVVLKGDFNPRGNVHMIVEVKHQRLPEPTVNS
jgi:7-cyano-7-deazaguanine reductase